MRTSPSAVSEIIDVQDDVNLSPFIQTANILVDEYLANEGLTATLLKEIEKYLAAHFVAVSVERGSLIRSSVGDSAETYQDLYETGLKSTRYGQQALALDSTGKLASLNSKSKAEFRVI